jgi:hypothetical protein
MVLKPVYALIRIDGQEVMIGHVLPITQPIMVYTLEPRYMIVDVYIQIDTNPILTF